MRTLTRTLSRVAIFVLTTMGMVINMGSLPATATSPKLEPVNAQQAHDIGVQAYLYFYPMLTMDVTRRQSTNMGPAKKPFSAPANVFAHMRAYPDANFKIVVRPNFDTLYSAAWLDLVHEPVIVSVPDTAGRYYLLPMLDMWSDVFAVPGWRTTGTGAHHFAVVADGWSGNLPAEFERINAPTPYVWIIGRTQTNGPEDYAAVHAIQDGLKITPLSQWGKPAVAVKGLEDTSVDMNTPPLETINSMSPGTYFATAAELLKLHNPHVTDWSLIAQLKRVGFEPGKSFDIDKIDPAVAKELSRGAADALKLMSVKVKSMGLPVNGWNMNTDSMGVYGNYYLKRAIVAMVGLGANQPEDAIYPLNFADADGQPLTGEKNYVLHMAKEQLPPVAAFWSLTMYDAAGYQVANPINRFAISSWMPLKKGADGSIDIYIQHENPGPDKESNWLPAPSSGTLGVTMRLYAPAPGAINGDWVPPAITKAK